jgi:Zn-dependent peptidase ImmA (M78 family)
MSPTPTLAHIEPEVLKWARQSAGYTTREAADKIGLENWQLEMIEGGGDLLTLRQAESAAAVYERPLAALFLPNPPPEEPQEVQFRRLPGAPEPPWGPEMQLAARRVERRQQAALELHEALEEPPPWPEISRQLVGVPRDSLAAQVRALLGISRKAQRDWPSDPYAPLREWRAAVEAVGVLVMQDGPVPVEEMRGFASLVPAQVPAILVNNKDDPRARAFTLVHELGHLVLAARGEPVGSRSEPWCDDFAGQVLMPHEWVEAELAASSSASTLGRVDAVARAFHVTPLAAAVRVARAGLIPRDDAGAVIAQIRRRWRGDDEEEKPEQGGGSYYVNQIARFGPGYLRLVFSAMDTQAITLPAASTLLEGVKVKYFDALRDRLEAQP